MNDPRINTRLRDALYKCHVSSREIFREMIPLLEQGRPYGWVDFEAEVFANEIKISPSALYHSLEDLRRNGVLRKSHSLIYCPALIAELVIKVVR